MLKFVNQQVKWMKTDPEMIPLFLVTFATVAYTSVYVYRKTLGDIKDQEDNSKFI